MLRNGGVLCRPREVAFNFVECLGDAIAFLVSGASVDNEPEFGELEDIVG
jgi:hypothetical protein